jgi:hypothetical protein
MSEEVSGLEGLDEPTKRHVEALIEAAKAAGIEEGERIARKRTFQVLFGLFGMNPSDLLELLGLSTPATSPESIAAETPADKLIELPEEARLALRLDQLRDMRVLPPGLFAKLTEVGGVDRLLSLSNRDLLGFSDEKGDKLSEAEIREIDRIMREKLGFTRSSGGRRP